MVMNSHNLSHKTQIVLKALQANPWLPIERNKAAYTRVAQQATTKLVYQDYEYAIGELNRQGFIANGKLVM